MRSTRSAPPRDAGCFGTARPRTAARGIRRFFDILDRTTFAHARPAGVFARPTSACASCPHTRESRP
ncbi:hypothetical protein BURMUCF2_A0695 [Burkholderia multivorans CF2]|nr:hypothetical protein BURMUCF2_A0695 [Burkholderia multivorans CF2]